jgi:2-methylcitrate dehydratase PrpD
MSEGKVEAAEVFADHLASVKFMDLPSSVVAAVKASILDTIGCMLAGTSGDDVVAIRSLVVEQGGAARSTLIGAGLSVPASQAVLYNAATAHQHDYDDTHDLALAHPTSASFPAALALGEAIGGVDGKDLITAVALGNDVTGRVGMAINGRMNDYPWIRGPIAGAFGATAASAKILGATANQHLNALGLMLPMTGGTLASLRQQGSSVRSIRDGLTYRSSVLAAELAMRGLRGDAGVFEGPFGLYQSFMRGEYDRDKLVGDLGMRYESEKVSLKPWPSIRSIHNTLTALIDVIALNDLKFDDISTVTVSVGQINKEKCVPLAVNSGTANHIDLLANILFAAGATIRYGKPFLALYHDSDLANEVIRHAMPKVHWIYDTRLDGPWTFEPASVEIRTTTGQVHVGTCDQALGHPSRPMSEAEQRAKFLDCARNARVPLAPDRTEDILQLVDRLEEVGDITAIAKLLA